MNIETADTADGLLALNLAGWLCTEVYRGFEPNALLTLRWPHPVAQWQANKDINYFLMMVEVMVERNVCGEIVLPHVRAMRTGSKVDECRVWTFEDDLSIDQSMIQTIQRLWECLVGGRSELTCSEGHEVFKNLIKACEDKEGNWKFAVHKGDDEDGNNDDREAGDEEEDGDGSDENEYGVDEDEDDNDADNDGEA
jgi:hypothetical protein